MRHRLQTVPSRQGGRQAAPPVSNHVGLGDLNDVGIPSHSARGRRFRARLEEIEQAAPAAWPIDRRADLVAARAVAFEVAVLEIDAGRSVGRAP